MYLHEVLRKGGTFRRKSWNLEMNMACHVTNGTDSSPEIRFIDGGKFIPFEFDLLADDWVSIQEPLTITRDQLYAAIDGHPMDVPAGFTDTIWGYLKEIVEESNTHADNND